MDLVKFFSSKSWQGKFADIASGFAEQTQQLQRDLAVLTNRGVASALDQLDSIQDKLNNLMEMVFHGLLSRQEQEISEFVMAKGGEEKVLQSDALLGELLKQLRSRDARLPVWKSGADTGEFSKVALEEVRRTVGLDIEIIMEDNRKTFENKFEAQRLQIVAELKDTQDAVVKQGDRIVQELEQIVGPHGQIVNKVRASL